MNQNDQEIEAKFYLRNLEAVQERAQALGAVLLHERHLESNLRFDTPRRSLRKGGRVLRLRLPAPGGEPGAALLTYKGAPQPGLSASVRQEIEVTVSDLQAARRLLNALGYHIQASYEKYRTEYRLGAVDLAFDELPYGRFVEIEAADEAELQTAAIALGLKWEGRVLASYMGLFETLCERHNLPATHLTFGVGLDIAELGLLPAD